MAKSTGTLVRDQFTWLTYFVLGYYSYLLNGLGPVTPFLQAELHMSYTLSSLHFSAFAVGILIAGLTTDRIVRRFGRRRTFWIGVAGMTGGLILLLAGFHPAMTICGALIMGTIGSLVLVIIPAALSEQYGALRAVALSEANVIASLCGGMTPVMIGVFVKINVGWRGAFMLAILTILGLAFYFRHVKFPEALPAAAAQPAPHRALPAAYWMYWGLLICAVSVEFCMIFWSASFLETERAFARSDAAFAVSIFLGAMVVGRFLGGWLSRRKTSEDIMLGSVVVCLGGFLLYWWAKPPVLTMLGLFVAGLGVSNFYPQLLALAVGSVPQQSDVASARASLASGIAILLLPLLLGWLADQFGLWAAYGIVIPLLLMIGGVIWRQRSNASVKVQELA